MFSSFCNDVAALGLLGVDDIIEAITRLLWECDVKNKQTLPSIKLPQQITARYKSAASIAAAIKVSNVLFRFL